MTYFTPKGDPYLFRCPCGKCDLVPAEAFVARLERLRGAYGRPLIVTSGPRCPEYNQKIGGAADSDHLTGEGADLACTDSRDRYFLLETVYQTRLFNRLGIGKTFVHVGMRADLDRNVVWHYYPKE